MKHSDDVPPNLLRPADGPPQTKWRIVAYGMHTAHDAMVEVRLRRPLKALTSTGQIKAQLQIGGAGAPNPGDADIMWFYRTHLQRPDRGQAFAAEGGLLLLDIDDHPAYLPNHPKDNFLTLRGVHAVTTTNAALADVLRRWNPEVHILANTLLELPPARKSWDLARDPRLHLVFAALNRTQDWAAQCSALRAYLRHHGAKFRATVLHDEAVYKDLAPLVETRFQPLVPYAQYLKVLETAHVVLMPLRGTEFNRVKSDLKILETLAAGALPIVSPTVAGLGAVPAEYFIVAHTPQDWATALAAVQADPVTWFRAAQRGRDYIGQHALLSTQVRQRLALFEDLIARHPALEAARQRRLAVWRGI